ncbi:MAG: TonB-dependent siderophore receptor [Sphingomicrobium sp.]
MSVRRLVLATAVVVCATPATGATAIATAAAVDEIVVTATRDGYAAHRSASATRSDTDLLLVPQSVNIITARQIGDQAMRSISDVLRTVPGVALNGGEGHRDHIVIRGNSSTADFFVDGLRDDVQYYRGLYNLERVEVLKGPNAMIFGRGGGGGVINRVTKRGESGAFAHATVSSDERGAADLAIDLNAPLTTTVAGRVNAVAERFDSFRDAYSGHRFAFNPTVAWRPNDATRLDLALEYTRDTRVVDRGIPSATAGTIANPALPLDGYRSTFFGQRGTNRARFTGAVASAAFEHRFSPALRLVARGLAGDYDKFYRNAQPATAVTIVKGAPMVGIEAYEQGTKRKNLLGQVDVIAEIATGPIKHTLVAGIDYAHQRSDGFRYQGYFDSGVATVNGGQRTFVPLGDTIDIPPITFRAGPNNAGHTNALAHGEAVGIYVQDQATIAELVTIVAGLRRDHFRLSVDDRIAGATFARTDNLWSPRLGLVLTPSKSLSFYGSHSRSFLPQSGDQFGSLTVTTAALEPEKFTNREIGAKWRPIPGLDLAAALYRLDRTNTRAIDPVSGLTVLSGAQRSKGLELSANGQLASNFLLSAGAAWQSARITSTTTAAPSGRRVALVPRFQASLWGRYDFDRRFGVGLGATHQSSSFASISNSVLVPAWTRIDGALFAKLSRKLELQLNLENMFDKQYIGLAATDNNLTPANGRTLRVTLHTSL